LEWKYFIFSTRQRRTNKWYETKQKRTEIPKLVNGWRGSSGGWRGSGSEQTNGKGGDKMRSSLVAVPDKKAVMGNGKSGTGQSMLFCIQNKFVILTLFLFLFLQNADVLAPRIIFNNVGWAFLFLFCFLL
jgi:hypothetical protein